MYCRDCKFFKRGKCCLTGEEKDPYDSCNHLTRKRV